MVWYESIDVMVPYDIFFPGELTAVLRFSNWTYSPQFGCDYCSYTIIVQKYRKIASSPNVSLRKGRQHAFICECLAKQSKQAGTTFHNIFVNIFRWRVVVFIGDFVCLSVGLSSKNFENWKIEVLWLCSECLIHGARHLFLQWQNLFFFSIINFRVSR